MKKKYLLSLFIFFNICFAAEQPIPLEMMERLYNESKSFIDRPGAGGNTWLHNAAIHGNTEAVKWLLKHDDIDSNKKNGNDETPLILASYHNKHPKVVELLLNHKADPNSSDKDGDTPLICAIKNNNIEIANQLLSHPKINSETAINAQNNDGDTPLICAARNNNIDIIKKILEYDVENTINSVNKRRESALVWAVEKNNIDITEDLLKNGADATIADENGNTVLLMASSEEDINIPLIKLLIDHGANVNAKNNERINAASLLRRKIPNSNYEAIIQKKSKKINHESKPLTEEDEKELQKAIQKLDITPKKPKKGAKFTPKKEVSSSSENYSSDEDLNNEEANFETPDRSKKTGISITLSGTLHNWKNDGEDILEAYGYLKTSDRPEEKEKIFSQIKAVLNDYEETKQAIIDAHSIVPIAIMRYLIEHADAKIVENNIFKITTEMAINFSDQRLYAQGEYELIYEIEDSEYIIFHSLFKDKRFKRKKKKGLRKNVFSSLAESSKQEKKGESPSPSRSPSWKNQNSQTNIQQEEKDGKIIFQDTKTGITFTIPQPE